MKKRRLVLATLAIIALPFALALLGACAEEPGPDLGPGGDPWPDHGDPDDLLAYDVMPRLELRIAPADVDALEVAPRQYVPATIVFDGEEVGPVGVRVKGQDSFLPFSQKPSLRINVNEYIDEATFHGLKDLTLNNMSSDPSMMHERLAYLVARETGFAAPRANHLVLTINGEPYGLYANVETVKQRMIGAWFDDDDGPLFEATDVDFTEELVPAYDLESGPDDRRLLDGLAAALALPDADEAIAAAADFVDLDHFQRYWAMGTIVGQFDAFPYSLPGDDYFLYADPVTGRLWFVPWGMDETFLSAEFPPLQIQSVLATRCKQSPPCLQGYVDRTWELLAITEDLGLEAERAAVQAEIEAELAADPRKPYSDAEITEYQTQLGYFIRGRREILTASFPPPSGGAP